MSNGQAMTLVNVPLTPMARKMYNVVGSTAVTIISPVGVKYLAVRAANNAWNLRPGRHVALTASSVSTTNDTFTITGHGLRKGFGPYRVASSGTIPPGLSGTTDYYIEYVDDNTIKFATSLDNLSRGVYVDITGAGSGTITIKDEAIYDLPSAAHPGASVTNGGGAYHLQGGDGYIFIPAPNEFSARGYAADSVLSYYWI
jgi:hypothetical protein